MLISGSQPGAILDKGFELVTCKIHKTIDSEGSTIIIILLFLLNVMLAGGVPRGEVTFEEVSKKIGGSFTTSSQLILGELDKGIELVNVTLELSELLRQGREVFTKDASGGLSVNEGFADDDLDQEESCRAIPNVPTGVPGLHFVKARERQGGQDASDHLHILLGSPGLTVDIGSAEGMQVISSEPAMVVQQVQQVVEGIRIVLGNFKVPTTGGSMVTKESKEGLQASRLNIEVISRVLVERLGGLAVDCQTTAIRVIDDTSDISWNQSKSDSHWRWLRSSRWRWRCVSHVQV